MSFNVILTGSGHLWTINDGLGHPGNFYFDSGFFQLHLDDCGHSWMA